MALLTPSFSFPDRNLFPRETSSVGRTFFSLDRDLTTNRDLNTDRDLITNRDTLSTLKELDKMIAETIKNVSKFTLLRLFLLFFYYFC